MLYGHSIVRSFRQGLEIAKADKAWANIALGNVSLVSLMWRFSTRPMDLVTQAMNPALPQDPDMSTDMLISRGGCSRHMASHRLHTRPTAPTLQNNTDFGTWFLGAVLSMTTLGIRADLSSAI